MASLSMANEKVFTHFIQKTENHIDEQYSQYFIACVHGAKAITEHLVNPEAEPDLGFSMSDLEGISEHEIFDLYDLSLAFFTISMDGPNIPGSDIERVDQLKKLLIRSKWSDFLINQIKVLAPEIFSGNPNNVIQKSEFLPVQLEAYSIGVDKLLGIKSNHEGLYRIVMQATLLASDQLGLGSENQLPQAVRPERRKSTKNPIMIGQQTLGEFISSLMVFLLIMLAITVVASGIIFAIFDVPFWKTFGGVLAGLFIYMTYTNATKSYAIGLDSPHPASIIFPIVMALVGLYIFANS